MPDAAGFWAGQLVAVGVGVLDVAVMLALRKIADKRNAKLAVLSGLQLWGYVALSEAVVHFAIIADDLFVRLMLPVVGIFVAVVLVRMPYVRAYKLVSKHGS